MPTREFFKNDKEMQQVIGGYTIIQLLDRSFKPEDLKSNRKLRTGYFSARRKVPVELRKKEEDRRKLFELYAKKKAEWHKRIASLKKEYDARRLKRLDSGRAINHFSRPPSPYRAEKKSLRVGAKTGAGGRNSATSISSTGFIKNSDRVDLINRAPKGPAARSFSTLINSPRINNKSAGDSSTSWTIARSMTYYITRGHAQTFILRPSNRNTHLPDQRFFSLTPRPLLRHFNKRDGTNIVRRERGIGANDRRSNSRRLHWSRKTGWPGGLKMGPAH